MIFEKTITKITVSHNWRIKIAIGNSYLQLKFIVFKTLGPAMLWWGSSSGNLWDVEQPFIAITLRSTLSRIDRNY